MILIHNRFAESILLQKGFSKFTLQKTPMSTVQRMEATQTWLHCNSMGCFSHTGIYTSPFWLKHSEKKPLQGWLFLTHVNLFKASDSFIYFEFLSPVYCDCRFLKFQLQPLLSCVSVTALLQCRIPLNAAFGWAEYLMLLSLFSPRLDLGSCHYWFLFPKYRVYFHEIKKCIHTNTTL